MLLFLVSHLTVGYSSLTDLTNSSHGLEAHHKQGATSMSEGTQSNTTIYRGGSNEVHTGVVRNVRENVSVAATVLL